MAANEPQLIIGKSSQQVRVTTYVDGFYWSCEVCGWLGKDLLSIEAAQAEGGRHVCQEHPEDGPPYTVKRRDLV